ncbi:MAG: 4Fe-4S binding protein, partial [Phycisphaeraceae bacterium]|nr:4Fe-4S binding protein [Phycisphaeraceae bacterium]
GAHAETYDIILVNVPDPLLPVCRDMMSPAFYALIQQALTPLGLAAFSGPDANTDALPQHLALLGATQYRRLDAQFLQTLAIPGQPMFFLCSQINYMTTYAPRLEARFSLLDQAEAIWPRDHLEDIYTPTGPTQLRAHFETVDPNISFSPGLYRLLHIADTLHLNLLPVLKTLQQTGPWCLGIVILVAALTRVLYKTSRSKPERILRQAPRALVKAPTLFTPLAYILFWIGLSLILMVHVIDFAKRSPLADSPLMQTVPEWTDGLTVTSKDLAVSDETPSVPYKEVRDDQGLAGYIFQTRNFTHTVYGYGGPIDLILFVEPNGTLIDFRFTQSYETRRYIRYIRGWLDALKGRRVFGPTPMNNVHAVSGATLTTRAVLRLMRTAGQKFATEVLAQESLHTQDNPIALVRVHKGLLLFIAGLFLAAAAIFHGKLWSRMAVLVYTTGTFGFWLNKQYSTDHIMRVLEWDNIFSGSPESLALLIGVPTLILLLGNLYCGYLCPFGAIQELVGLLVPKRFKPRLSRTTVQGARFGKYAVLFAIVISVFAFKNQDGFLIDPLTTVFNTQLWPELFVTPLWLFLGIGILFVTRFWCRYLCPTGAFLSLLNRCVWLQRLLPAKKYGRCEFGLTGRDHLDCIYCDRCNIQNALIPEQKEALTKEKPNLASRFFLIWLLITASLLIWPLLPKNGDLSDPNTPSVAVEGTP